MRVVIDRELCESTGMCVSVAPEIFEFRDDDIMFLTDETPPEALRAKAEAAARVCPKQAITIEG